MSCGIKFGTKHNTWVLHHIHVYASHLTAFNAPDSNPISNHPSKMSCKTKHEMFQPIPDLLSCTPQLLHTRQTISAMLSSSEVAAIHNITHSLRTRTCTTHQPVHYTAFHAQDNPLMPTGNKHKAMHGWQNGTRCRDGVKSIPNFAGLFWGFHPYMFLFSKLFATWMTYMVASVHI